MLRSSGLAARGHGRAAGGTITAVSRSVALVLLLVGAACPALAWDPRVPLPPIPCQVYPADNVWNADVSALPVHARSADWVSSVGPTLPLHPDFGTKKIGIPYAVVPASQPAVPIQFNAYGNESDPGPYPVPPKAPIERGSDRHVLVVQTGPTPTDPCGLHELFAAHRRRRGTYWTAASGAFWDLGSNALRTADFTSADAAGLPILAGLVRYDEILNGAIHHALRFTVPRTQQAYLWPARHFASTDTDPSLPPMGARFRLKASVDLSGFSPTNQIILTALRTYGMFVADNGGAWFVTGAPDPRWSNDDLHLLTALHGSDFEAVDESALMVDPDSGRAQ
jgi:hypothetical protein